MQNCSTLLFYVFMGQVRRVVQTCLNVNLTGNCLRLGVMQKQRRTYKKDWLGRLAVHLCKRRRRSKQHGQEQCKDVGEVIKSRAIETGNRPMHKHQHLHHWQLTMHKQSNAATKDKLWQLQVSKIAKKIIWPILKSV